MNDQDEPHLLYSMKVPFIFVPHGSPPPLDWMAEHPGALTVPATFVPRARQAHPPPGPDAEPDPAA